jgi:hypothetical protein
MLISEAIHSNNKYIRSPPKGTPEYDAMVASGGGPQPMDIMKGVMPFAYAMEQGTKPSTAGLVMGCNPMSLLSWYVFTLANNKNTGLTLIQGTERSCSWSRTPSLIWTLSWLSFLYGGLPIPTLPRSTPIVRYIPLSALS